MWSLKEREREKRLGSRRNVLVTARNGLDRSISFAFKSESKYCPAEKSFLPAGGQCSDGEMQSNRRSTRKKRPFQSVISAQRIYITRTSVLFQSKRFSSSGWIMKNRMTIVSTRIVKSIRKRQNTFPWQIISLLLCFLSIEKIVVV